MNNDERPPLSGQELSQLARQVVSKSATQAQADELLALLLKDEFEPALSQNWEQASAEISPADKDALWQQVQQVTHPQNTPRPSWRNHLKWVAAAVAAVICVAAAWWLMRPTTQAVPTGTVVITVERGQKSQITLADGTHVWLNSGTRLTYDAQYGSETRTVTLDGEAYFDVAKDSEHPFVVRCGELAIRALGTQFNVKGYHDDGMVTTTLSQGSVRVSEGRQSVTLKPYEVATYHPTSQELAKSRVDDLMLANYWRSDKLVFESEPLANICRTIERMYGVDVEITDTSLEQIRFTGTIRNNSLNNIFLLISMTYPVTYTMQGDHVTISKR